MPPDAGPTKLASWAMRRWAVTLAPCRLRLNGARRDGGHQTTKRGRLPTPRKRLRAARPHPYRDRVLRSRNAVMLAFFFNGLTIASWVSRIPEVRSGLHLANGQLGLLLLTMAVGSLATLPTTGALLHRWGAATMIRIGVMTATLGLVIAAVGTGGLGAVPVVAVGLVLYGVGTGIWDVAMNVEGAVVERGLGRTIMPRFHAGFSLGTVAGAGLGAATTAVGVPLEWHLTTVCAVTLVVLLATVGGFLPRSAEEAAEHATTGSALAAWREPRTL